MFNFHPTAIKLIVSYLSDRIQCVRVNNTMSDPLPIKAGVPQDSALGPLLFIMFINDLTNIGPCYLFADDCNIEQIGDTPENTILLSNALITHYTDCYNSNVLKLNADKTTTDGLQHIVVNGHTVAFSNTPKYFGLTLDQSLNWKSHVASMKRKSTPIVWNLARIRNLLDAIT